MLGLPQRMLRYQFGPLIAAYQNGDQKDLARLAEYALNVTPDSEEALLWKGLAFEMAGNHQSAITLFNKSLEVHPGYQEAEKALAIVRP
jgi:tetratricopeptide (TPR) repeat protein